MRRHDRDGANAPNVEPLATGGPGIGVITPASGSTSCSLKLSLPPMPMQEKSGWRTCVSITPTGRPAVSIDAITASWKMDVDGHALMSSSTGGETVHAALVRSAKLAPLQDSGATASPDGATEMPFPNEVEHLGASVCSGAASTDPPAAKSRSATVEGLKV